MFTKYDRIIEHLIDGPYWVADILPKRVPAGKPDRYFDVERYFLQPERIREIYRNYAEVFIRLNCYYSMAVSFDCGESWEVDPDPSEFVRNVLEASDTAQLRVLFPEQRAMIDLDFGYTDLAVYDPDSNILDLLRPMLLAEGFFLWPGEES
ncbi:MAG: hypothetical protein J6A42_06620 [Firmicutes bacterium]|nr:hypothetical protein [Bacillota bacterium]